MVDISCRQFHLRQLFGLIVLVALALGIWLPDAGQLAQRQELAALLLILLRVALGWVLLLAAVRRVRLFPPFWRGLPFELQVLFGLTVLLIALIAAAILLPPLD